MIGACVLDRSWAVPFWIPSLLASCDTKDAGLVVVINPYDQESRLHLSEIAHHFKWIEILKYVHNPKGVTVSDAAAARQQLLMFVQRVGPKRLALWDPEYMLGKRAIQQMAHGAEGTIQCTWAWINRQPPRTIPWLNPEGKYVQMTYQPGFEGTAMLIGREFSPPVIQHFPASEYVMLSMKRFRCDLAIGPLVMGPRAYRNNRFTDSPLGEHASFLAMCRKRKIIFECNGPILAARLNGSAQDDALLREAPDWKSALERLVAQTPEVTDTSSVPGARSEFEILAGLYPAA